MGLIPEGLSKFFKKKDAVPPPGDAANPFSTSQVEKPTTASTPGPQLSEGPGMAVPVVPPEMSDQAKDSAAAMSAQINAIPGTAKPPVVEQPTPASKTAA